MKANLKDKASDVSKAFYAEIENLKTQLVEKDNEKVFLIQKSESNVDEIEDLKRRLLDAETTLAKYRARKEKVDKRQKRKLNRCPK